MKPKRGFLEELFNLDPTPSPWFPERKKADAGTGKRRLSNREECPACGTLFPAGGVCPGCGRTDEEMPWGER